MLQHYQRMAMRSNLAVFIITALAFQNVSAKPQMDPLTPRPFEGLATNDQPCRMPWPRDYTCKSNKTQKRAQNQPQLFKGPRTLIALNKCQSACEGRLRGGRHCCPKPEMPQRDPSGQYVDDGFIYGLCIEWICEGEEWLCNRRC